MSKQLLHISIILMALLNIGVSTGLHAQEAKTDTKLQLESPATQKTDHATQIWRINERNRSVAVTLRAKW